jgi:hypothetical protein
MAPRRLPHPRREHPSKTLSRRRLRNMFLGFELPVSGPTSTHKFSLSICHFPSVIGVGRKFGVNCSSFLGCYLVLPDLFGLFVLAGFINRQGTKKVRRV